MGFSRRLAGCALAAGALALSTFTPAWAGTTTPGARTATTATAAATGVGPVSITVPGVGQGPDNIAYEYAFQTAYGAAAHYGFSSNQCHVTFGPVRALSLPNGYTQWILELTCSGEPVPSSTPMDLTRYNGNGDHLSTTWNGPLNVAAEGVLGRLYSTPVAGTRPLYMCKVGKTDTFTSTDVNCEGQAYKTRLGWIYSAKPAGVSTRPIRRCRITSNGEHFDSIDMNCEGQTTEGVLGYALT